MKSRHRTDDKYRWFGLDTQFASILHYWVWGLTDIGYYLAIGWWTHVVYVLVEAYGMWNSIESWHLVWEEADKAMCLA